MSTENINQLDNESNIDRPVDDKNALPVIATSEPILTSSIISRNSTSFIGFPKKEVVRCTFCGGKDCPRCGLNAYKAINDPAINLLHSNWITENIIGSQRPNNKALLDGALESLKEKKVSAIFNLTEPGEHPFCGTGLLDNTGFPYDPSLLMSHGIKHFNFNWPDMTVPSLQLMLDIVSIARSLIISNRKILVHCHAGYGRTGLMIGCLIISTDFMKSEDVIKLVRARRPGSIQTKEQVLFLKKYESFFFNYIQIFPFEDDDQSPSKDKKKKGILSSIFTSNSFNSNSTNSVPNKTLSENNIKLEEDSSKSNSNPNPSSYTFKSIKISCKNQQFFLSNEEKENYKFLYEIKFIYQVLNPIMNFVKKNNPLLFSYSFLNFSFFSIIENAVSIKFNSEIYTSNLTMTIKKIKKEVNINKYDNFNSLSNVLEGDLFTKKNENKNTSTSNQITTSSSSEKLNNSEDQTETDSTIAPLKTRRNSKFRIVSEASFCNNNISSFTNQEFLQSQVFSVSCLSSLLIEWFNTRSDYIFSDNAINQLRNIISPPNEFKLEDLLSNTNLYEDLVQKLKQVLDSYYLSLLSQLIQFLIIYSESIRNENSSSYVNELKLFNISDTFMNRQSMGSLVKLKFCFLTFNIKKLNPELMKNNSIQPEFIGYFLNKYLNKDTLSLNVNETPNIQYSSIFSNELIETIDVIYIIFELLIKNNWKFVPFV